MSSGATKRKRERGRATAGRFLSLPHVVLESSSFINLRPRAVKLLLDVAFQYDGRNNGNLTVACSPMKERGWSSKDTLSKAVQDLIEANLIVKTRTGRFMNPGAQCYLYAVTWRAIDECQGKDLEVGPTATPPRKFSLERSKNPSPETGHGSNQKLGRERSRDERGRFVSDQKSGREVEYA